MDNYDPNLILDLAAGLLPDDEARAAEAALTPEGRAELAAQRAVMAAIAGEPSVSMTDIERARLHRSVADGLAATTREMSPAEIARPQATTRSSGSLRWFRWASAATAAALFVGVVAVASQLPGSSSDSSDTTVGLTNAAGAERDSSATTAAGSAAAPTTTTFAEFLAGDGGGDGAAEDLALPEVRSTSAKDDLASLALELQEAQRFFAPQTEELTALDCYEEAAQELTIVDWSFATYVDSNGSAIEAIGYATLDGDGVKLAVQLYALSTCDPIVTD